MTDAKPPESGNSRDVLSSLPTARPQRRSPKRDGAARAKPAKRAARPGGARSRPATGSRATSAKPPKPVAAQGYQPVDVTPVEPPSSGEILISAVQAAGEVAQIGLTLGERLLRAAASRLPRP